MRVCHIVPSLEERHGGPSKSVRSLAAAQATLGPDVELLFTGPADASAMATPAPNGLSCRGFARQFPARIYRSSPLRSHLRSTPCDCVHSHALWIRTVHYAAEAARRQAVPLVLSPRGMLSPWAYRHHRGRKWLAERLVHPGALCAAAGWHATSTEEADDIRRLAFTQPICVAPNGVVPPSPGELELSRASWLARVPAARHRPVALFYSRFHRKKRLRELLDLWLAAPRGEWHLVIAGVPEEYSIAEVRGWCSGPGAEDRVSLVDATGLPPPYALASLFLLPSHSENFGLVIAEAMAAGVPVLVTDSTPWRGVGGRHAGWCVPWEDYARTLRESLQRSPAELAAMGERGRAWMAGDFSWEQSARRLLDFYRQLRP